MDEDTEEDPMGVGTWFKDQRAKALADPVITTLWGGDKVVALHQHSIRSGTVTIPLEQAELHLETGSEIQSRVTATRLVAFGIFALALKKQEGGERYLTVESPDESLLITVPAKKVKDAMKFLNAVKVQKRKISADA